MSTGTLGQAKNRTYYSKFYFWSIFFIGLIIFLNILGKYPVTADFLLKHYWELLFFLIVNILTEISVTSIPTGGFLTASFSVISTILIVHGPVYAIISSVIASIFGSLYTKRRHWSANFFNAGLFSIIFSSAGLAVELIKIFYPFTGKDFMLSIAICSFIVTLIYMVLSSVIVNSYISLDKSVRFIDTIKGDKWEFVQLLILTPVSIISVYFYLHISIFGALGVFLPAVFTVYFIRNYIQTEQTIVTLRELNNNLTELYEFTKKIGTKKNIKDLWITLIRETEMLIQYDNCIIYKIDYSNMSMSVDGSEVMFEDFKIYDLMEDGFLQNCVAKRSVIIYNNFKRPDNYEHFWGAYNSILLGPLILKGEVSGVFCMMSYKENAYSEEDVKFLKLLLGAVESTITNIELHEQSQKLALVDGLTGLYNQKYFKAKVSDELRRANNNKLETSVIMMDMDYFKKFNDTHGHLLGDLALKDLASIIKSVSENNYVVSRYGGEEFAILLPETSLEDACLLAERLRLKMIDHKFTGREQREVKMTISIGVNFHSYQHPELSQIEFIDRADTALYRAKNDGRNQVYKAIYSPEKDSVIYKKYSKDDSEILLRNVYVFTLDKQSCHQWKNAFNNFESWINSEENQNSFKIDPFYLNCFMGLINKKLENADKKLALIFSEEDVEHVIFTKVKFPTDFYKFENDLEDIEKTIFDYVATLKFPEIEKEHIRKIIISIFNKIYALAIKYTSNHYQKIVDYHTNISHINSEIGVLSTKQTFYSNITKLTSEILNTQYTFIAELDNSKRFMTIKSFYGISDTSIENYFKNNEISVQNVTSKIVNYAEAVIIKNENTGDTALDNLTEKLKIKSGMIVPLIKSGKNVTGMIACLDTEERVFSEEEIKICQEISERVVKAINRIDKNYKDKESYIEVIKTMIDIFESKSYETKDHSKNVSRFSGRIAKAMALSNEEEQDVRISAYLHDIGMLGISEEKLADPEALTSHSLIGARIISSVSDLSRLAPAVRHHHECWNGSGYPDGLEGTSIPLHARIIAVSNGYEEFIKEYKESNIALDKMKESNLFDPEICELAKNKVFNKHP